MNSFALAASVVKFFKDTGSKAVLPLFYLQQRQHGNIRGMVGEWALQGAAAHSVHFYCVNGTRLTICVDSQGFSKVDIPGDDLKKESTLPKEDTV